MAYRFHVLIISFCLFPIEITADNKEILNVNDDCIDREDVVLMGKISSPGTLSLNHSQLSSAVIQQQQQQIPECNPQQSAAVDIRASTGTKNKNNENNLTI